VGATWPAAAQGRHRGRLLAEYRDEIDERIEGNRQPTREAETAWTAQQALLRGDFRGFVTRRVLLDKMYPPLLADMLRDKGHDVRAGAASAQHAGADDATVLEAATADGCCVLTENVRDFAMLARYTTDGRLLLANSRRWPRSRNGIAQLGAALHDMITSGTLPRQGENRWQVDARRSGPCRAVDRVRDVVQRNRHSCRSVLCGGPAGRDRQPAVGGVQR
jgi:Domain of unknown function (DUF5615)